MSILYYLTKQGCKGVVGLVQIISRLVCLLVRFLYLGSRDLGAIAIFI